MNTPLPPNVIRYGGRNPLPEQHLLRAGPFTVVYEAGNIRYVRFGSHEVLRRVYVAVRDHNWGTVAPSLSDEQIEAQTDSFQVSFVGTHKHNEIDYTWHGEITGETDGTLRFVMDGEARSSFRTNRTGFCVLHPAGCAGASARVGHIDGSEHTATFPQLIAPQVIENGQIQPVYPFADMRALAHEFAPGMWAEVRFSGDVFELEDQRNWIDGSFKTYCRPLRLPFPYEILAGTKLRQRVTLSLIERQGEGERGRRGEGETSFQPPVFNLQSAAFSSHTPYPTSHISHPTSHSHLTFTLHPTPLGRLPAIGLGCASHGQPLSGREIERLRALNLAHIRVDLELRNPGYLADLRQATVEARALGVPLEIALFVSHEAELVALQSQLAKINPPVVRWLVFSNGNQSIGELVRRARTALYTFAPDALCASGTNAYFTELNRNRPNPAELDMISYSVNPQVHAFDHASLMQTPATIAATVASARAFAGGKPIIVSPITLKPRFNAVATGQERELKPDELPPQVDPRQMSLFGACWTLAGLKYLAESGVTSTTFYETTGWRGVMETEAGSPLPERFLSLPGTVFPLYHVFADFGEFVHGTVLRTESSNTLVIDGMALQSGNRLCVLLANLSNQPQHIHVGGLPDHVLVRMLDEHNAAWAMQEPEAFRDRRRTTTDERRTTHGVLEIVLEPYANVRLDQVFVVK